MAPKRGAASQGGRAAKKAAVDPFDEALGDALALLNSESSMADSAKQLLTAAAPFCLKVPPSDRHEFQAEIVTALQDVFKGVAAREEEQVKTAEADSSSCAAEVETCGRQMSELSEKATSAKAEAEAATKAQEEAAAAVQSAKEALKTEKGKEATIQADHEKLLETKKEREALVGETWTKLKTETSWGKMWRNRDKMIEGILEVLSEAAVEESLKLCMPVAMKAKPDERGHFAKQTIEHCEAHLQKSLAALEEKIQGHDAEVAALKAAITAAEAAVTTATEDLQAKENTMITTDNASMEASEKKRTTEETQKELETKHQALNAKLEEAKSSSASVAAVLKRFQALVDVGAAGGVPEAAPEEAPAEAAEEATA